MCELDVNTESFSLSFITLEDGERTSCINEKDRSVLKCVKRIIRHYQNPDVARLGHTWREHS